MELAILIVLVVILILNIYVCLSHLRLRRKKENEQYTDYVNGNLVLRIFKPEFEFQAIGNIKRDKLLDRGIFSPYYNWALIEK